MYSMLIVDDEKIERRGIQSLISKFSFPFDVVEAKNGKEALEYLKANPVDILLTDIKMPFMDGIELAKEARALFPNIKIIIFSAYGEFEYAKKAMGLNVIHFILKPIDIDEFFNVMSKVVQLCTEDEVLKKEQQRILQGYQKGIIYEREKLLFQLLYACEIDEEVISKAPILGFNLQKDIFQPLLIECSQRFFDTKGIEFEGYLNSMLKGNYYSLNLNERQSLIFLDSIEMSSNEINNFLLKLKDWIIEREEKSCAIVIGRPVIAFDLYSEYNLMEQLLEYKFFIEGSAILKVEDYSSQEFEVPKNIDDTLEKIYRLIEIRDDKNIKILTEALFEILKNNEGLSSIYVKHVFMEIIRRIFDSSENNDIKKFRQYLDKVYNCNNIGYLKDIWLNIFAEIYSTNNTNLIDNRKVIDNVLDIIREEYSKDIGVEYIADRVYLSPNYLGQLFKKHTGKNLTRYIMEYRLTCAKEFLENTNLKIVDICERAGFTNSSYFNLIFKNHYGITPAQYREKVK